MPSVNEQDHLWIAVGDIHDEPGLFARIPELAQADGIIVTGDLTITGGVKQAELVMDVLRAHNPRIWAQIGNMDRPEVDEWLSGLGCNLHTQVHELTPDTAIFGIGASTFTPFGTPSEFPESTFAGWLESSWQKARKYPCWFRTIRPRTAPATSSRAISMWALLPCANSLKKPSPMSACADISTKRAPWTGWAAPSW